MPNPPTDGVYQHWEPPDTICARYVGHLNAQHVRVGQEQVKAWQAGHPYFLIMINVSELGSISSDARQAMTANGDTAKALRATAVVGASFHFRAIGTMIARAVALLNRHNDNPIRFFNTENEARLWLAERRHTITSSLANAKNSAP